jgi:hypothetical protein
MASSSVDFYRKTRTVHFSKHARFAFLIGSDQPEFNHDSEAILDCVRRQTLCRCAPPTHNCFRPAQILVQVFEKVGLPQRHTISPARVVGQVCSNVRVTMPSVFGRNVQCQPVRGSVPTQEACY